MNHIRNFENYKRARITENKYNSQVLLLQGVELSNNDEQLFKNILEKVLDNYKNESIRQEIKQYLTKSEMLNEGFLNEGFFDKLKDRFPKAAEISKILSDKAESALSNILNKVKDAVSFVKKIGSGIKELFLSVVEKSKAFFIDQIKNGKLKDKIAELTKNKKEGLMSDLSTVKEIITFYKTKFMSKLLGSCEKNMGDFLSKEQDPIAEGMINEEKGNVISTLIHGIEKIPPFNFLQQIANTGEAGANKLINVISNVTNKLGGPNFALPVIGILIGLTIEYVVKDFAGHWLIDIAGDATGLGLAIKGVKILATVIAFFVAIDAVTGGKALGGGEAVSAKTDKLNDEKTDVDQEEEDKEGK